MRLFATVTLLACGILAGGASMASDVPPGTGRAGCLIAAHLADSDPAGTNVRSGPSPNSPILTRLPRRRSIGEETVVPEVVIVGFDHGWAKVRAIRFADYGEGETLLLEGPGWISGTLLSGTLQAGLRAGPDSTSALLAIADPEAAVVVMVALDGRFLDSPVHPFDLAIGKRAKDRNGPARNDAASSEISSGGGRSAGRPLSSPRSHRPRSACNGPLHRLRATRKGSPSRAFGRDRS